MKESLETLKDVKERLHKTQDAHNLIQKDYDKVTRQVSISRIIKYNLQTSFEVKFPMLTLSLINLAFQIIIK